MGLDVKVAAAQQGLPEGMPDSTAALITAQAKAKGIPILLIIQFIVTILNWMRTRRVEVGLADGDPEAFDLARFWKDIEGMIPFIMDLIGMMTGGTFDLAQLWEAISGMTPYIVDLFKMFTGQDLPVPGPIPLS
jgi:hypothetical protein